MSMKRNIYYVKGKRAFDLPVSSGGAAAGSPAHFDQMIFKPGDQRDAPSEGTAMEIPGIHAPL
jgi:hypothetical protein